MRIPGSRSRCCSSRSGTRFTLSATANPQCVRPSVCAPTSILDVGMPLLSGYDAAHLIRKSTPGKKILIVALSGWGRIEDVERSKAAGMDYHLVKPLELAKLKEILDSLPKPTKPKRGRRVR